MGIGELALRLLLPRGSAWALAGDGGPLVSALGKIIDLLKTRSDAIISESRPGTATDTLPEWHKTLGQHYDSTRPLPTQRFRLDAFLYSSGGATVALLQAQIDLEYTGITVSERPIYRATGKAKCGLAKCGAAAGRVSPNSFLVSGTIATREGVTRLAAIIARFAPKHLIPFSNLTIASDTGVARCGASICGTAKTGREAPL